MGAVEACHGAPEFEIKPILADLTKYEVLKNTAEVVRNSLHDGNEHIVK